MHSADPARASLLQVESAQYIMLQQVSVPVWTETNCLTVSKSCTKRGSRALHVELEYDNDLFGLSRGQFSALFLLRPGPPGLLLAQAGLLVKGPARRVADSDCISSVLASLAANLC